jgi:hypothetical protein
LRRVLSALTLLGLVFGSYASDAMQRLGPWARRVHNQRVAGQARWAQRQVWESTGVWIPERVIRDGVVNADATPAGMDIHSGLPPAVVKGATFHEAGHELMGHNGARSHLPTRQMEREADYMAGRLLMRNGYGPRSFYGRAYLIGEAALAGGDHGTPRQRVWATLRGMRDERFGR